jgi:predicted GNAT family acetyltransferase
MEWTFPDAYGPDTVAFLRGDPVAHTILLGVLAQGPVPLSTWAELRDGGRVLGAAWRTPPWGLGVTDLPDSAARELGDLVADRVAAGHPGLVDLTAVLGPHDAAVLVAEQVAAGIRAAVVPQRVETLYRIDSPDDVVSPARVGPAGRPRLATQDDLGLLSTWWSAFVLEAAVVAPPDVTARVRQALALKSLYVWDDGSVRAMVAGRETGNGVARLGPVYTPLVGRGRGVATALTEHVVRTLFAGGVDVVTLYADDANLTSSGIYRRLGFRDVLAWANVSLLR